MRAVGLMVQGGPEVLEIFELPEAHAGPGEVRVKVYACAVNPTDIALRDGMRSEVQKTQSRPLVPGMDLSGVVDEIGPGVETGVKVGDAVMAIVVPNGNHGAYREQIVLNAKSVAPIPKGRSLIEACTLPMNGLTARMSLDLLNLAPGQVLGVTGAAGIYGGYIVQLAKADGLIVIADAGDRDAELVKGFGADIVVTRGDDVAHRMREHFPNGVDGLADGAVLNERVVSAVKDGGAFTSVRFWGGTGEREIRFAKTAVREYAYELEKLQRLRQQAEDGILTLRVADALSPERASEAHRRLAAGGTRGRLVLQWH